MLRDYMMAAGRRRMRNTPWLQHVNEGVCT